MNPMPVIAIVGRPNVGKSSLLNALVGRRISIVQDMPGVTRDRISTPFDIDGRYVELVDTGGYGFVDPDQLTEHIRHQIELAWTRADLVLFIVDAQAGLTSADEQIASLLRRQGIKTVLVANKADGPRTDANLADFARLGLGTPVGVSALNDRNIDQLPAVICKEIDLSEAPTQIPKPEMLIAIVGKRNAGKSTLVNAIAKLYEGDEERVIVSEVPGTTRDSIDVRFEKDGHTLIVIDTAGVRKKRHMVTNDIEFYSFHRAQRSIRRADVVMLLFDGTERISEPDKKLAQYVAEQFKPVILVINKFDLVIESAKAQAEEKNMGFSSELLMDEFEEYLRLEIRHLDYAPMAFVTARDGKNVQVVLDLAQKLFKQASQRLTTGRLNTAIRQILQERSASTASGRRARVYYATQIETNPPTIALFVNKTEYFDDSYQRFILNRLRDLLPYPEVPIRLLIRPRGQGAPPKSMDEATDEELTTAAAARAAGNRTVNRPARAATKRPARSAAKGKSTRPTPKPARSGKPHRSGRPSPKKR